MKQDLPASAAMTKSEIAAARALISPDVAARLSEDEIQRLGFYVRGLAKILAEDMARTCAKQKLKPKDLIAHYQVRIEAVERSWAPRRITPGARATDAPERRDRSP